MTARATGESLTVSKSTRKRGLRIGSRVFFPAHGVVSVLRVEEREFGPSPQDFYILGLARGGKVMLPVGNVTKAGVRDLVSVTKARELLKRVKTPPVANTTTSWRERAATYEDALRSGSPDRYTEIVQELLFRAGSAKLSTNDKRVLEVARGYFAEEIGAVLDRPPRDVEAELCRVWDGGPGAS